MGYNPSDLEKVKKIAEQAGYKMSSDGSKMIADNNRKQIIISETEKSVKANGVHYNDVFGVKYSKNL